MIKSRVLLPILLVGTMSWAADTPYSGQDQREIASLSASDIAQLLDGAGWGFAKSAELNGYPGPAHVLELASELDLTDAQREAVQRVYDEMNAKARALGVQFVEAEAALDSTFEDRTATAEDIAALIAASAAIEAELRKTHLVAHLEISPLLTRHQRMTYDRLRGYSGDGSSGHDQHQH